MKTRLQRRLSVRRLHFAGSIRVARQRQVLVAMLRWVEEQLAAAVPASAAAMVQADGLLPGRPVMLGARLLQSGASLGLLDLAGPAIFDGLSTVAATTLTVTGEAALRSGLVDVPVEGVWEVLYSEDPLLPHPVLRLASAKEPGAHEEVQSKRRKEPKGRRQGARVTPPPGLRARLGQELQPPLPMPGYTQIVIDQIDDRNTRDYEPEVDLYLVLSLGEGDEPALRLQGRLLREKDGVDQPVPLPSADLRQSWSCLHLLHQAGRWDKRLGAVPIDLEQLDAESRRTFLLDLPVRVLSVKGGCELFLHPEGSQQDEPQVTLPDQLPFDDARLRAVPIAPADEDCARRWYRALLEETTSGYEAPAAFRERAQALRERFRGYRSKLVVPTQAEVAQELRGADRQPALYWRLQAPLDLPIVAAEEVR